MPARARVSRVGKMGSRRGQQVEQGRERPGRVLLDQQGAGGAAAWCGAAWRQCRPPHSEEEERRERLTGDPTVRNLNISPFLFLILRIAGFSYLIKPLKQFFRKSGKFMWAPYVLRKLHKICCPTIKCLESELFIVLHYDHFDKLQTCI